MGAVKEGVKEALRSFHLPVAGLASRLLRLGQRLGQPWKVYERQGVLPIPVHYHHPYPTSSELDERGFWDSESSLVGVELDVPKSLDLLTSLGRKYREECVWPREPGDHAYYETNDHFGYASAAVAHCVVREFRPRRIIEVGSGYSTHILGEALARNDAEDRSSSRLVSIEPSPPEILRARIPCLAERIEKRVEDVDVRVFQQLQDGDILFIDSSHVIRYGGDVLHLYLEVLPGLRKGVLVHVHDIHLPYPYPKDYFMKGRMVWNEQYLLQAFLCHNGLFEVLLPCWLVHKKHDDVFRRAFPRYDPAVHRPGSSFWIRRIR